MSPYVRENMATEPMIWVDEPTPEKPKRKPREKAEPKAKKPKAKKS